MTDPQKHDEVVPGHAAARKLAGTAMFEGLVRGMLPFILMSFLRGGPRFGSDLIRLIGKMTGGSWQPSPGSVYPILKRFEEEGLIEGEWRSSKAAPRRFYELTGEGVAALPEMRKRLLAELTAARTIIDRHIRFLGEDDDAG